MMILYYFIILSTLPLPYPIQQPNPTHQLITLLYGKLSSVCDVWMWIGSIGLNRILNLNNKSSKNKKTSVYNTYNIFKATMRTQKSPKSQKLLQFQTKLSKLNNKPLLHTQQQLKLQQILHHHKMIQADISCVFDQISQYYLKCQGKVVSVGKEILELVQFWENSMFNMLALAKEKEISAIKDEVEGYMAYNKKVKKYAAELQNYKISLDSSFTQQINGLKPYNNKFLHDKMQEAQDGRNIANYKIQQYEKIKENIQEMFKQFNKQGHVGTRSKNIKALMSEDEDDKEKAKNREGAKPNKIKQESEKKVTQQDNIQKMYKNLIGQNKLEQNQKLNKHLYNSIEDSQRQSIQIENRAQTYKNVLKNMFASQVDKADEKQENLMEQTNHQGGFKRDSVNNLKFYKPDEEQEVDEKTQKLKGAKSTQKHIKFDRHQSQPNISLSNSSQIHKNLNTFLQQLKRSRHQDQSHDISSREQISITPKTGISKFSRVKSEENLVFNYNSNYSKHQTTPELVNMEEYSQAHGKMYENISTKMSRTKLRESAIKTGRTNKGGWASILKAQQEKYNEMRKKIRN